MFNKIAHTLVSSTSFQYIERIRGAAINTNKTKEKKKYSWQKLGHLFVWLSPAPIGNIFSNILQYYVKVCILDAFSGAGDANRRRRINNEKAQTMSAR